MHESVAEVHPGSEDCRALLARILAAKEFQRASRLRGFLAYVVDRTLEGSPQEVTEVRIGQRVFGRPAAYNPAEDSIVRTEARVLRQRLEHYFATEGSRERIILEIPKGGYVPVFRFRESVEQPSLPPTRPAGRTRRLVVPLLCGIGLAGILLSWRSGLVRAPGEPPPASAALYGTGSVELNASDERLVKSFLWAKERALAYVYTGDPVGNWYDSTGGDRYAFCMRDISHEGTGAAVLGLTGYTENMLRHFAASISPARSWCGFWEINKDGFPAPVDYRDDRHFWYCLPANFDVMRACYRQYLWTGDTTYFDAVFSNFYDRSVTDYVAAWDPDRDGVMQGEPRERPRGIPSYYQQERRALTGADLVAAQYRGYLTYAAIQRRKGASGSLSQKLAGEYLEKAQALRLRFNTTWWNPVQNRFYPMMLADHSFYRGYIADANTYTLLFGIVDPGVKTDASLDALESNRPEFDQTLSYFPEILFQYGRNASAYRYLLELADPNFRGRGMPEAAFAVVGSAVTGLAGISPDAPMHLVETQPHLPQSLEWVKVSRVPVLENQIAVYHRGDVETTVTNQAGPAFEWRAVFPAPGSGVPRIFVDGAVVPTTIEERPGGQRVASVVVEVRPGQTRAAHVVE